MILGIDPDRGWAVVECGPHKRVVDAGTVFGYEFLIAKIKDLAKQYDIKLVRVERPEGKGVRKIPGVSYHAMMKIAHNVGENHGKAIALFCTVKEFLDLEVEYCPPIKGATKLNRKQIAMLTGWTGKTSEHARDAIMIAWR